VQSILQIFGQFTRMSAVSAVVNIVAYIVYLGLTEVGLDPKLAATICFAGGVLAGFTLNRRWTFRDAGDPRRALVRYSIVYGGAYVWNIAGLYVFVDLLQYPHQFVQAAIFFTNAGVLFSLQRFWIFRSPRVPGAAGRAA
jgi:putative flippase GtrA